MEVSGKGQQKERDPGWRKDPQLAAKHVELANGLQTTGSWRGEQHGAWVSPLLVMQHSVATGAWYSFVPILHPSLISGRFQNKNPQNSVLFLAQCWAQNAVRLTELSIHPYLG